MEMGQNGHVLEAMSVGILNIFVSKRDFLKEVSFGSFSEGQSYS